MAAIPRLFKSLGVVISKPCSTLSIEDFGYRKMLQASFVCEADSTDFNFLFLVENMDV